MAVDLNIYRSAGFTPEQARKLLVEVESDPLFRAGWRDKNHPCHERYITHRRYLHEVIASEPAPAGSTPAPWPKPGKIPEMRIVEARANPAYLDKSHPSHHAVVEDVHAAYRELQPTGAEKQS